VTPPPVDAIIFGPSEEIGMRDAPNPLADFSFGAAHQSGAHGGACVDNKQPSVDALASLQGLAPPRKRLCTKTKEGAAPLQRKSVKDMEAAHMAILKAAADRDAEKKAIERAAAKHAAMVKKAASAAKQAAVVLAAVGHAAPRPGKGKGKRARTTKVKDEANKD
jgi:hypothetical protein